MLTRLINESIILITTIILSTIVVVTGLAKVLFNAPTYLIHIFVQNHKDIRQKVLSK
jgi:sRNA-binding carbon storage regulator CsrA